MKYEFWEAPMWLSSTDLPWAPKIMKKVKEKAEKLIQQLRIQLHVSCSLETVIWKRKNKTEKQLTQLNSIKR